MVVTMHCVKATPGAPTEDRLRLLLDFHDSDSETRRFDLFFTPAPKHHANIPPRYPEIARSG